MRLGRRGVVVCGSLGDGVQPGAHQPLLVLCTTTGWRPKLVPAVLERIADVGQLGWAGGAASGLARGGGADHRLLQAGSGT